MTGRRLTTVRGLIGLVASLMLSSVVFSAPGASAETAGALPAALSDVVRDGDDVTGVLTLRAGQISADIDTAGLSGTLAGRPVELTVDPITRAPRRAMLVVDTSGSMGEERMQVARSAAVAFIKAAPKDVLIGLVSFANTAGVDVPVTADRQRLLGTVRALQSDGETALYAAVHVAVQSLGAEGERSIILLSDGGDTVAKNKASEGSLAAAALKKAGIRAEVVGFKTDETDNKVLASFAAAGGGTVVAAGNDKAVDAAFRAAAKALDNQVRWRLTPPADLTGTQELVLSGTAGARAFRAATTVDLGSLRTATTPQAPVAGVELAAPSGRSSTFEGPGMTWMLPLALVALLLGIFGVVAALLAPAFQSSRARRVAGVEVYLPERDPHLHKRGEKSTKSALTTSLIAFGDRRMEARKSTGRTMARIERADLPLRPGEWWLLRVAAIFVGAALGFLLLGGWIGLVIGLVLGMVLPAIALRVLAARRAKKFDNQLPDALSLVASSLGAGFSLHQALDAVAKDSADPLAKEFSRALAEARIGAEVSDALERVGQRMDSENMRWTSMAIEIQRSVGGNLATTLRTTAQTIRDRHSLARHVAALSAEGKLSTYILVGLPIAMFVYMLIVNRPYVALLWTTFIGLAMLVAAVVLLFVGIFWMSKTVKVEV